MQELPLLPGTLHTHPLPPDTHRVTRGTPSMAGVSSLYPGYSSVKALPRERKNGQIHNSFCPPAAGGDRVLSTDVTSVAWAWPLHPDRPWLGLVAMSAAARRASGARFTAAFTRDGGRRGGGDRVRGRGLGARGGNQPRPRLLPTQTRSRVEARHRRGQAQGCDSGRAGLCRLPGCACDDPVRRLLPRASRFPESLAVSPHGLRRLLRHHPSPELFSFCKTEILCPSDGNSPFPPPPFCFLCLCVFDYISHRGGIIQHLCSRDRLISLSACLQGSSGLWHVSEPLSLLRLITFHCMTTPPSVYPFILSGPLSRFHL